MILRLFSETKIYGWYSKTIICEQPFTRMFKVFTISTLSSVDNELKGILYALQGCSCKGSCVEDLVPNAAVFRGWLWEAAGSWRHCPRQEINPLVGSKWDGLNLDDWTRGLVVFTWHTLSLSCLSSTSPLTHFWPPGGKQFYLTTCSLLWILPHQGLESWPSLTCCGILL